MWNTQDLALIDVHYSPNFVLRTPGQPEPIRSREEFARFVKAILTAFPDFHVTIEDMMAEGDKVTTRMTLTGTHCGKYRGLPPTGRSFTITQLVMSRFEDGIVVEAWQELNALGQMQQFGVVPPEGASPLGFLGWAFATVARFARLDFQSRRRGRQSLVTTPAA